MDMEIDILAQTAMDFELGGGVLRWLPLLQVLALAALPLCALADRMEGHVLVALASA